MDAGDIAPLRIATGADHEAILAMIEEYYAYDEIPFERAVISAGLMELLRDESLGNVYWIESGSETAGYLICTNAFDLEFGGRMGIVTDFYLKPEFRRQGLGTHAMQRLFEVAAARGVAAIELHPERDNAEARAFYERNGFEGKDRVPMTRGLG